MIPLLTLPRIHTFRDAGWLLHPVTGEGWDGGDATLKFNRRTTAMVALELDLP